MYQNFKSDEVAAKSMSANESRYHSANGANPDSHSIRSNNLMSVKMKKVFLSVALVTGLVIGVRAADPPQNGTTTTTTTTTTTSSSCVTATAKVPGKSATVETCTNKDSKGNVTSKTVTTCTTTGGTVAGNGGTKKDCTTKTTTYKTK